LFLKVLKEYKITRQVQDFTTATVVTFTETSYGVMENVHVNTLENVKGIESKIKSNSSFYHVALFNI